MKSKKLLDGDIRKILMEKVGFNAKYARIWLDSFKKCAAEGINEDGILRIVGFVTFKVVKSRSLKYSYTVKISNRNYILTCIIEGSEYQRNRRRGWNKNEQVND